MIVVSVSSRVLELSTGSPLPRVKDRVHRPFAASRSGKNSALDWLGMRPAEQLKVETGIAEVENGDGGTGVLQTGEGLDRLLPEFKKCIHRFEVCTF